MRLRLRDKMAYIGAGAKWGIVILQLALFLNPYLVTGVDDDADDVIVESESRSPYVYLSQREYLVQPNGKYRQVADLPEVEVNVTSPPGSLKKFTERLRQRQQIPEERFELSQEDLDDAVQFESEKTQKRQAQSDSAENYGRDPYTFGSQDEKLGQESSNSPSSIQDILKHKQGSYQTVSHGGGADYTNTNNAPSYDSVAYQSPLLGYEVPSNYFPNEHFDFPTPTYTVHGGGWGGGAIAPFLSSVGQITSSVKHVKATLGEQKAKTAYQVADVVKNTGHALTNAIHSKGQTAAHIVGQTVQTAGDALRNKGWKAQQIIANKGHLASSAIKSIGNVGSSLLRSKGELIGAAIKSGAAIGTTALGTASNALAGGTYLVKAKGDAASNLIAKGGRLASGVIGTKGRLISSVINAKGQFAAQIIEAKGKAAATLLEAGGQKLTELAYAIKSATAQKGGYGRGGGGWAGWSEPNPSYTAPEGSENEEKQVDPNQAQLEQEEQTPQVNQYQHAHQYQQDYANSYYDPRDYQSSGSESISQQRRNAKTRHSSRRESTEDLEDFQSDYSSHYPQSYGKTPSSYPDYYNVAY